MNFIYYYFYNYINVFKFVYKMMSQEYVLQSATTAIVSSADVMTGVALVIYDSASEMITIPNTIYVGANIVSGTASAISYVASAISYTASAISYITREISTSSAMIASSADVVCKSLRPLTVRPRKIIA